jgi:ribosomal protein S18 acetylase RimI-like enzyme
VRVRPATEADIPALTQLDATYTAGRRVLVLTRSGEPPELAFSFRWEPGEEREEIYATFTAERVRGALARVDRFLVAEVDGAIDGVLMVIVPSWTDAGEITDLVVDRRARRRGAGRALVGAAAAWARERGLRGLWAEPGADNDGAIAFYLSLGFRISGFNDRWNTVDTDARPTVYLYLGLG